MTSCAQMSIAQLKASLCPRSLSVTREGLLRSCMPLGRGTRSGCGRHRARDNVKMGERSELGQGTPGAPAIGQGSPRWGPPSGEGLRVYFVPGGRAGVVGIQGDGPAAWPTADTRLTTTPTSL